MTTGLK